MPTPHVSHSTWGRLVPSFQGRLIAVKAAGDRRRFHSKDGPFILGILASGMCCVPGRISKDVLSSRAAHPGDPVLGAVRRHGTRDCLWIPCQGQLQLPHSGIACPFERKAAGMIQS